MAQYELLLPKMGESVAEATVIKWVKQIGDSIDLDDTILEIATDKVDSEVPSPVAGKLVKQLFKEDEVAQVGDVIAIIETEDSSSIKSEEPAVAAPMVEEKPETIPGTEQLPTERPVLQNNFTSSERFYSPLVKSIAAQENISTDELDSIKGSGADGRLNKDDLLNYLSSKGGGQPTITKTVELELPVPTIIEKDIPTKPIINKTSAPSINGGDEIIEMDRMRKLIADHMVMSVNTSPHVTSFVEADVTNMVLWRNKVKNSFEKRENEKITFTPIFVEAVAKAIKDFPMVNVSVNGTQIIKKRDINIGMAAALPNGNLIVPVIKNADQLNLVGLTKAVNDLAGRARISKLKPDETQGGTFTLTNVGTFGNVMGTPIINQPQVAILAVGAIKKKPAVLETEHGDVIAIRHMMFLSLSYDHRVVDGSLGGMFVRRVADYLENWDLNREI
ncbi:dihydrolipoamide acetyltransferase family protein [Pedobacter mendelii]|uniref:Dihydrolipoamide acetyltransferase component of pyruvate dehydrogenase complex n=1 Tax=Pedobacter mendelii TaxID=1908240 RepID=A0ABQ2BH59_9SPHI|nr:dihydrolipoamide acetyltransferase family protein [Pedobacter mendelii]GGI26008.1 dihydrolipoamide acetyltransferase component of pyruvate dehydrogenase complex [Pedobacter mendelii]